MPLKLTILKNTAGPLPESLLQQAIRIDPNTQIRHSWDSMIDRLAANACRTPDVIVGYSTGYELALEQIKELRDFRERCNYSPRPIYLAITAKRQSGVTRLEIERAGGYFLYAPDVPTHFRDEIENIRLELDRVSRSLPFWRIVLEGSEETLQTNVSFLGRGKSIRLWGKDRMIASLAAFIKHNGIARSAQGWLKIIADDPLFKPTGGPFQVPSPTSLKMYLRREFPNCLQRAFDEYGSGFCAKRVLECINPRTHAAQYQIRGECEVARR
jgi:hypothetical protein